MTTAVALGNLVLGLAYLGLGVMTLTEMRRDWSAFGFSRFGVAFIAIAFTCGPHHLFHGIHLAFEGRTAGPMDLISVFIGVPVAAIWLFLRVETFVGGRGDRYIVGTPRWLQSIIPLAGAYLALVVAATLRDGGGPLSINSTSGASAVLVVIYLAIGWSVLRTQLAKRSFLGGWSVSGLCLAGIFLTCAVMHVVYAAASVTGRYRDDAHGPLIIWLSIPAGLSFLWVVRQLYRDSLRDWNSGPGAVPVGNATGDRGG